MLNYTVNTFNVSVTLLQKRKRPELTDGMLLQVNTRQHVANLTSEKFLELDWKILRQLLIQARVHVRHCANRISSITCSAVLPEG